MRKILYINTIVTTLLCIKSSAVLSDTWHNTIDTVSEKSSRYYDYAIQLDPASRPGSIMHGLGFNRNRCAIIGRMLGLREEIAEAENLDEPEISPTADPFELMEYAMILDSWVAAARRAVEMTESQKINLWNLECVGNHGISKTAFLGDDTKADFSTDGDTLYIYGDIDAGFYERFENYLETRPNIKSVMLGSAGGSVRDAILSGYLIREKRIETTLFGPCFSACPLVFAGGIKRNIWMGSGPHLGFHQVYNERGALPINDEVYLIIVQYLTNMGIDAYPVVGWMFMAGPDEIFEPKLEDLCIPRFATWIQRTCSS